jgi:hypothetical protein
MGNRGVLHGALNNESREIVRRYASRRWISCLLDFKGRWRAVMSPRRYTELFFLDEAVALAAGHRPCAECRRERFNAFKEAWLRSENTPRAGFLYVDEMDLELHRARIDREQRKITYRAPLQSLPDGCFVEREGAGYLVWGEKLFHWSPAAYLDTIPRPPDLEISVLTPAPIVRCLRYGYKPEIHNSLRALR